MAGADSSNDPGDDFYRGDLYYPDDVYRDGVYPDDVYRDGVCPDDLHPDDLYDDVEAMEPYGPPPVPRHRTTPTVLAAGAIFAATVAILVSAVLLMSQRMSRPLQKPTEEPAYEPTRVVEPAIPTGTAPTRTRTTIQPPTSPPPEATTPADPLEPSTPASATLEPATEAPLQTGGPQTKIVRPPMSVAPDQHPAFPHN